MPRTTTLTLILLLLISSEVSLTKNLFSSGSWACANCTTCLFIANGTVFQHPSAAGKPPASFSCIAKWNLNESVCCKPAYFPYRTDEDTCSESTIQVNFCDFKTKTLYCPLKADPSMEILWSYSGKIGSSKNSKFISDRLNSTEILIERPPEGNVNYTCFGRNSYGNCSVTFEVILEEGPGVVDHSPTSSRKHPHLVKFGDNVTLSVKFSTCNTVIMLAHFEWMFGNRTLACAGNPEAIYTLDCPSPKVTPCSLKNNLLYCHYNLENVTLDLQGNYTFSASLTGRKYVQEFFIGIAQQKPEETNTISATISISTIAVFLTVCCVVGIFWYKKRLCRTKDKARKPDYSRAGYKYDFFVAFSERNSNWVGSKMIVWLEEKFPDVKLCVHYKQFSPGVLITDNIRKCILDSWKIVAVISRDFVNSYWCRYELAKALSVDSKIVLVFIDDVEKPDFISHSDAWSIDLCERGEEDQRTIIETDFHEMLHMNDGEMADVFLTYADDVKQEAEEFRLFLPKHLKLYELDVNLISDDICRQFSRGVLVSRIVVCLLSPQFCSTMWLKLKTVLSQYCKSSDAILMVLEDNRETVLNEIDVGDAHVYEMKKGDMKLPEVVERTLSSKCVS